jgi:hypothetical protein
MDGKWELCSACITEGQKFIVTKCVYSPNGYDSSEFPEDEFPEVIRALLADGWEPFAKENFIIVRGEKGVNYYGQDGFHFRRRVT